MRIDMHTHMHMRMRIRMHMQTHMHMHMHMHTHMHTHMHMHMHGNGHGHTHRGTDTDTDMGMGMHTHACAAWASPECTPSGVRELICAHGHAGMRSHKPPSWHGVRRCRPGVMQRPRECTPWTTVRSSRPYQSTGGRSRECAL